MIKVNYLLILTLLLLSFGCAKDEGEQPEEVQPPPPEETRILPDSDPENTAGWEFKESVSDEFDADELDEEKWLIQGTNGVYQSNFIGRAPSQFSTDNVRIEDGILKLDTRWDPDFPFSGEIQDYGNGTSYSYENMTTAAVVGKNTFLYGYMEIRCKAADASITSSFWMTGTRSELDVFEFLANPKQSNKAHLEKEMKSSIHDWSPGAQGGRVWTNEHALPFRVADDFHTYGCDWSRDGLKFYVDGELIRDVSVADIEAEATAQATGSPWVINEAFRIWVDSETFPWHGIPEEGDLPVDFEIDYIRVWQK